MHITEPYRQGDIMHKIIMGNNLYEFIGNLLK